MNKNINICNNCGKYGHLLHQCKLPITSYGIILFKKTLDGNMYMMIRRKDSYGYIDFIRGKYSPYNIFQLQNIINQMTLLEKHSILTKSYDELWNNMWGETYNLQYKSEGQLSLKKMELIKTGIMVDDKQITLQNLLENSPTQWTETEWEFPKGRRNYKEKDLDCALREFEEETGISKFKIKIIENVLPFEEIFIGTNHKSYKHKYFLAYISDNTMISLNKYQLTEVSNLEWKSINKCLESIRPYNLEKKELITNIDNLLNEIILYS
jgi:8-oxo-dGTP pyrophosphatase MutT (NUDIX family)